MAAPVSLIDETRIAGGVVIARYELRCGPLRVEILTAGCAIARLEVPDRTGQQGNVVLAHRDIATYLAEGSEYFGVCVGRVANRIAQGRFRLGGREYQLAANNGPNHLHGGVRGFDRRIWSVVEASAAPGAARLKLRHVSPDGEEGYPGKLVATVTYTLHEQGELRLEAEATTDAPTIVNLTNHTYFNFSGGEGDVLAHHLQIEADRFCAIDGNLIPTGELPPVAGTPFDFREARPIGEALRSSHPQLVAAGGFDHCYALRQWDVPQRTLRRACVLSDPRSGRRLTVATDQPGVQFYSGNFLDGRMRGPDGVTYRKHAGLCLETQAFPNAPNQPGFPSIELRPGQRYSTVTTWRFDV